MFGRVLPDFRDFALRTSRLAVADGNGRLPKNELRTKLHSLDITLFTCHGWQEYSELHAVGEHAFLLTYVQHVPTIETLGESAFATTCT